MKPQVLSRMEVGERSAGTWRAVATAPRALVAAAVGAILLAAALLRFWALGHGIPYAIGVDEPEIMERVVQMMKTGDFNPRFFDYPGLYFYLQLLVACARFLTGAIGGLWRSLDDVGAADFYLWGRATTALLGTATVFLVYQIGRRWGTREALLAALLMAVIPSHVRESHFVLTDVPVTFFTTLTLLLALRAHERGTLAAYAWAGAAAGLAAATKYNGGLALLLPLVAALRPAARAGEPAAPARAAASTGACAAAFLLAAPYTLLDLPSFLNAFAYLASHYRPRDPGAEPGWLIYLKHLQLTLRWPAYLAMFLGIGCGAVAALRGPGRTKWLLLLAFPAAYFYVIAGQSLIFGRYLLPLLPFVSLAVALAVIRILDVLPLGHITPRWRHTAIALLTMLVVVPPALASLAFNRTIGRPWTQALAYEWIQRNIPDGSVIAVERYDLRLPGHRYQVEHVVRLTDRDHEDYVAEGFEYIIASSQVFGPAFHAPQHHSETYAAYRRLFDQSQEAFIVRPSDEHPGPELRIYRLREGESN